jgi:anion-transporting  ArsA/GET3 family ATPase
MGVVLSKCFGRRPTASVASVLSELKRVDAMLQEMVSKYETQVEKCNVQLKQAPRSKLLPLLRRRKLLLKYVTQCEQRMAVCLQKQCALEQVAVTKMQIEAIRKTSKVFKRFTHTHAIERVEKLQDDMEELENQLMDINELLMEPVIANEDLNVEEELAEMMRLETEYTPESKHEFRKINEIDEIDGTEETEEFEDTRDEMHAGEELKLLLAAI